MKNITVVVLFLIVSSNSFSLNLKKYEKIPKSSNSIKTLVEKIDKKSLMKVLKSFVRRSRPSRIIGSTGHKASRKFIIDHIKSVDSGNNFLKVDEFIPDIKSAIAMYEGDFNREIKGKYLPQNPTYKKWRTFTDSMVMNLKKHSKITGKNIIFEKKGNLNPNEVIILGANYDTIVIDNDKMKIMPLSEMPGADNNGTGVAILLKIIELLVEIDIPKTVRIVFFDFEELGFLGSKAFIKKYYEELKKNKIKLEGFVNLLMLGHDSKRFDLDKNYNNMKLYIRKKGNNGHLPDIALAEKFLKMGKIMDPIIKFELMANGFESSSQINFWEKGIPSIVYTQNWEKDLNIDRYHTSNDIVETINDKTFYRAYKHIAGATIAWTFDIQK